MNEVELSEKQAEYIANANHRWNGKVGATQCGKTYVDTLFVIPDRIRERKGKKGLNFITGVSKETITRNVIEPLQEIYGSRAVTDISSNNTCKILGEKVYCIGADNVGPSLRNGNGSPPRGNWSLPMMVFPVRRHWMFLRRRTGHSSGRKRWRSRFHRSQKWMLPSGNSSWKTPAPKSRKSFCGPVWENFCLTP